MKKLFLVFLTAGSLVACNNTANTTTDAKDSLDSVANAKKAMIDSSADVKKDKIDSSTEKMKDAVNTQDSAMKGTDTAKHNK